MKLALLLMFTVVAMGFPAENLDSGNKMSELINSINKIQARVKDMRGIAMGNSTEGMDTQIKDGINALTRNVTYEELIDKVQQASLKIKEMQAMLSGTLKNLDKKYPRPSPTDVKQEPEKL